LFVCLFVCCYKTQKFLLCLPLWARKTPGSIYTSTQAAELFLRSYQRYTTVQNHSACQLRLTLYTLASSLASLSLNYASPTLTHPQPTNSVPRSPTSDPREHWHSRQSRALNTNTQGSQGERKGEGATHEHFGSWKKRPPDNKAQLNLDHMDLLTWVGEIVDTLSSYLYKKTDTTCTQSMRGVASYSKENRYSTDIDTTVMEACIPRRCTQLSRLNG